MSSRTDTVIVNSGCANLASVVFALERLGERPLVSDDPEQIVKAGRVILPGVGSAGFAMTALEERGLVQILKSLKQPVLGVCLGMQLLFDGSAEGDTSCLGLIEGQGVKFDDSAGLIVPHMGWNDIRVDRPGDPLLRGIADGDCFYFVHSYYLPIGQATIASSEYGTPFSAIVRQGNFWGCQFHPERSADAGAQILRNFLELS